MQRAITRWDTGAFILTFDPTMTLAQAVSEAVREGTSLARANLTGADLRDATLAQADLTQADLTGANLTRANLTGANLTGANLTGANLWSANLWSADLAGAVLTGTNLTGADLTDAGLPGYPGAAAPASPRALVQAVRAWLTEGRWIQRQWIRTPDGAYGGHAQACLHGAIAYFGGPAVPSVLAALRERGFNEAWNDAPERTLAEVQAALDTVLTTVG